MVTGLGAVTAAGWGVAPFRLRLLSGQTAIGPFDRFDHSRQRTHVAAQVPPEPQQNGDRCVQWNRLSNSDRFALFSAMEAVRNARLTMPVDGLSSGVFFGSSTGGLYEAEQYFAALRQPEGRPSRALLASHGLNAPAETVARHLGVQGPVETISSACASGALAIEQALRAVRDSEVDVALAGGADCLCVTTYSGFNSLRAIDERPCRPFRSDRAGLSLGEGGAVLVLERIEHARARGARPLAEIVGAGSSCDAHHMTAPQAGGEGAALAVQRALDDAGLEPGDVDFINAHGTGTPLNDAAEYSAFVSLFGDAFRHLPIEATKSSIGHLLGTSGAIEAMAAVLSLVEAQVHPAPAGGVLDPKLLVDLVLEKSRPLPEIRTGLSTSFGFGGANAAVIFRRWEEAA